MRIAVTWAFAAAMGSAALFLVWRNTLADSETLRWSAWAYSDFLISYDHGFVRRGLLGALLPAEPPALWNGYVFALYALALLLLAALVRLPRLFCLVLLAPGGFFAMALHNEFYFRKEFIFYVFTLSGALWLRALPRAALAAVVFSAAALVQSLIHEGFLFLGAPVQGALLWIFLKGNPRRGAVCAAYAIFNVLLFSHALIWRGDAVLAAQLWAEVPALARALMGASAAPFGGIAALGWDIHTGLGYVGSIFRDGFALTWLGLLLLCGVYTFVFVRTELSRVRLDTVMSLYGLLFLALVPLFIIAWDWGRWVAALQINAMILVVVLERQATLERAPVLRQAHACGLVVLIFLGLLFRVPECCLERQTSFLNAAAPLLTHLWR